MVMNYPEVLFFFVETGYCYPHIILETVTFSVFLGSVKEPETL